MKTQDFMQETIGVADVFGRSKEVKVVFEGDGAFTDGSTITLPSLPQEYDMNDEAVKVARGYMDHESYHIRVTDWDASKPFFEEVKETNRPVLQGLVNCIEDLFIERKGMELYPGSEKNLYALGEHASRTDYAKIKELPPGEFDGVNASTVSAGILTRGRRDYSGEATKKIWDLVPEKVQKHAEEWQKHIDNITCTQDSINLGKAIYKLLRDDPNLDSESEDFDPDNNDLSGIEDGDGELTTPVKGQGDLSKLISKLMSGEDQEGDQEGEVPSMGKKKNGVNLSGYRVLTTRYDSVLHRKLPKPPIDDPMFWVGSHADYSTVKRGLSSTITTMKSRLRRALSAKENRDWDFGREAGTLDSKRFSSVLTGSRAVYKRRVERDEQDTVVSILIDCSGSMAYDKIEVAQKVAVALAESVEGSGIKYEILGFTNRRPPERVEGTGRFHRRDALLMYVFKDVNERLRVAQPALSTIPNLNLADNSDRDAIQFSIARLKKQPEKRKVLIVLSDGSPCHYSDVGHTALEKAAKEVVVNNSKEVEIVGIGIMTDAVKEIYSDYLIVNDVSDLQTTVLRKLTKILIDGRLNL